MGADWLQPFDKKLRRSSRVEHGNAACLPCEARAPISRVTTLRVCPFIRTPMMYIGNNLSSAESHQQWPQDEGAKHPNRVDPGRYPEDSSTKPTGRCTPFGRISRTRSSRSLMPWCDSINV